MSSTPKRGFAALGRDPAIRELGGQVIEDALVADELRLQDLRRLFRVVDAARCVNEREGRTREHLEERSLPEAIALGETARCNRNRTRDIAHMR
jgi:hypothetical protein